MKYVVVLGDGMADWKIKSLGDKTCLEKAYTPTLDSLAPISEVGLCDTVPEGMSPGSDVANMSVLGFNPRNSYTGRSPLEAVAMGIDLKDTDVTLRANVVTLSNEDNFEDKTMVDYSAGEISTDEARELINYLKQYIDSDEMKLFPGVSYRHCLVIENGVTGHKLTPPHDISDKKIGAHLPKGENGDKYIALMKRSHELLKNHPINLKRISEGKNPANSLWFWGEGTKPMMENFEKKNGLKGGAISAVDLVKGISLLAGMQFLEVEGMTGNYDTNFQGKADVAVDALLGGLDYVYIHMEGPDECGHHGDEKHKVYSIEQIDKCVVKTVVDRLTAANEDFVMLVAPDHPTPCAIKTHVREAIPYLIYASNKNLGNGAVRYTEDEGAKTGKHIPNGFMLIDRMLEV